METYETIARESGRLDQLLASSLDVPRNQTEILIEKGCVTVDGIARTKKSFKLIGGETIRVVFPAVVPKAAQAVDFDMNVLYEDEAMLVVNKPAGLVVHDAPSVKTATLVDWLVARGVSLSTLGGEERHGIVHRIDKDTTGALAVAKTNEAHTALSGQLADKSMGRYYLAVIEPPLKEDCTVDAPLGRHPSNRLKVGVVRGGREARSAFAKLAQSADGKSELIAVKLFTGRTHQIRAHLASLGRVILGDTLYGFKTSRVKIERPYLHAYILYLRHPVTGLPLTIVAPLHEDMKLFLEHHFGIKESDETLRPSAVIDRFADGGLCADAAQTRDG